MENSTLYGVIMSEVEVRKTYSLLEMSEKLYEVN